MTLLDGLYKEIQEFGDNCGDECVDGGKRDR